MNVKSTRLLKAQCGSCAYTVRVTRRWIAELGTPICPCNHERMECPEYEQWTEDQRALEVAFYDAQPKATTYRVVREQRKRSQRARTCEACRGNVMPGDDYFTRVEALDGAMRTRVYCSEFCAPRRGAEYGAGRPTV